MNNYFSDTQWERVEQALHEVCNERLAQHVKWGEQNLPNGTGGGFRRTMARLKRLACEQAAQRGTVTWGHVLEEEFSEAMAETDPAKLKVELIQVAAVAVAWVEQLDRDQPRALR